MSLDLISGFGAYRPAAGGGGLTGAESDGTNLITGGNNFAADWSYLNTSGTTNNATASNGATEALLVTEQGGTSRHGLYQIVSITDAVHTASVYGKFIDRRYLTIFASNNGGTASEAIGYYDLQTGVVTDTDQSGTPQSVATSIAVGASGFYKCTLQFRLHSSVGSCFLIIAMSDVATYAAPLDSGQPSYASTLATVHLWRPKVALGAF